MEKKSKPRDGKNLGLESIGIHAVAKAKTSMGMNEFQKKVSQSVGGNVHNLPRSGAQDLDAAAQHGDAVGAPAKKGAGLIKRGTTRLGLCSRNVIKDQANPKFIQLIS